MIRSFEVENFLSIKERQVVNFEIHKSATDPDRHFIKAADGIRVPAVVAIFGANGAGKTAFLRVLRFLADFIQNSTNYPANTEIPVAPFLSNETINEPSDFLVSFDLPVSDSAIAIYEYRLRAVKDRILYESLHYSPGGKNRRVLFIRDHQIATPHIEYGPDFRDQISAAVPRDAVMNKPRASLISLLAQFGHKHSMQLQQRVATMSSNVVAPGHQSLQSLVHEAMVTQIYRTHASVRDGLREFLRYADLGIEDVDFGDLTTTTVEWSNIEATLPTFRHRNLVRNVKLLEESDGTRALYSLILPIITALLQGGIAVIDEFDSDIHPMMIPKILERFQSRKRNKYRAQLIFCGHNPYTLSCLEKEEVYFAEKSRMGASSYYGLRDVKGVRRSDNFFVKYLSGVYGGVPNV
jgi:hypothetical protein